MCTGACLVSAAQHWGEWGLGPTPREPPPAGLTPAAPVAPQPLRIRSGGGPHVARYGSSHTSVIKICVTSLQTRKHVRRNGAAVPLQTRGRGVNSPSCAHFLLFLCSFYVFYSLPTLSFC